MGAIELQYGRAGHVRIPIVKRGVVDFAVGADWTPAAGDVKVSKDGGAAANIATLPTAVVMGNTAYWDFPLSATELTAEEVKVTIADSPTKAVEDQAFLVHTKDHPSARTTNGVVVYGMAQGGAAQSLTLPTGANSVTNNAHQGQFVRIRRPSGVLEEWNAIPLGGYTASSQVAQMVRPWVGATPTTSDEVWVYGSVAGSTDLELATSIFGTALPGAFGAGTAGKLLGDLTLTGVAAAVWDALESTIATASSIGLRIKGALAGITGSGLNTLLGYFQAMMRKTAALTPSDIGGTFDNTTESLEGLKDGVLTGDAFVRLGAPSGASIAADIATRASSTEVTAIQNNTRVVRVVPEFIERPASSTRTYRIEILLYDAVGNMEAPDSAPTITLVNESGTDRSSRLDSPTMALVSTGRYRAIYTSTAGDAVEQLLWAFSVVEGGATRIYGNTSPIVDTQAVDFTAADRTKLDALHDVRLTAGRAANLDNLNATVSSLATAAALVTAQADLTTLISRLTNTRATLLDNLTFLDASVASRLAAAGYTAPDNAGITAIYGKVDTEVAAILALLDTEIASALAALADLQARLPAALTAGGRIKASLEAIADDANKLLNFERATGSLCRLTVGVGSTATNIVLSASDPAIANDDQFIERTAYFSRDTTTAALRGVAFVVKTHTATALVPGNAAGGTKTLPAAPASGDLIVVS